VVVFAGSRIGDNTSVYDPYWSVVPPAIAVFYLGVADPGVPVGRQVLVTVLVWAWAIRLTANWARSFTGLGHEDFRYAQARDNGLPYWPQSLLGFHLVPTLQVYLGCLALWPAIGTGGRALGPLDVVATLVTGGAIVLELVADEQLRTFNRNKSPGDICTVGVWSRCRHPNYLGELSFWWGLWIFALAADPGWWWTVVGPLAMTAMFVFASIPMMDRRSLERRPGYEEYMDRVPAMLPRPGG
jgi:steroid 5-alpha reductase family enzyme